MSNLSPYLSYIARILAYLAETKLVSSTLADNIKGNMALETIEKK